MVREFDEYLQFEATVADLLKELGHSVERESARPRRLGEPILHVDILATSDSGAVTPVEVKLTGGPRVTLQALRDAISKAASLRAFAVQSKPLLVVSGSVHPANREWATEEFRVDIWDREDLLQKSAHLRARFEAIFERRDNEFQELQAFWSRELESDPTTGTLALNAEPPPIPRGQQLIDRLSEIKPGKKGAKAYERICRDIVEYLFGEDLRDGRSSKKTEDKLNFYDLVYRVNPKHQFWLNLTRDFRARVILFECKNYSKAIGPTQVFTTERYLSASALRPICFVLSRLEPHKHAVEAAFGAMRESGKLLVFLSDRDLIEMIKQKDASLSVDAGRLPGNDPTEVLDQKIYDFIAGMPR